MSSSVNNAASSKQESSQLDQALANADEAIKQAQAEIDSGRDWIEKSERLLAATKALLAESKAQYEKDVADFEAFKAQRTVLLEKAEVQRKQCEAQQKKCEALLKRSLQSGGELDQALEKACGLLQSVAPHSFGVDAAMAANALDNYVSPREVSYQAKEVQNAEKVVAFFGSRLVAETLERYDATNGAISSTFLILGATARFKLQDLKHFHSDLAKVAGSEMWTHFSMGDEASKTALSLAKKSFDDLSNRDLGQLIRLLRTPAEIIKQRLQPEYREFKAFDPKGHALLEVWDLSPQYRRFGHYSAAQSEYFSRVIGYREVETGMIFPCPTPATDEEMYFLVTRNISLRDFAVFAMEGLSDYTRTNQRIICKGSDPDLDPSSWKHNFKDCAGSSAIEKYILSVYPLVEAVAADAPQGAALCFHGHSQGSAIAQILLSNLSKRLLKNTVELSSDDSNAASSSNASQTTPSSLKIRRLELSTWNSPAVRGSDVRCFHEAVTQMAEDARFADLLFDIEYHKIATDKVQSVGELFLGLACHSDNIQRRVYRYAAPEPATCQSSSLLDNLWHILSSPFKAAVEAHSLPIYRVDGRGPVRVVTQRDGVDAELMDTALYNMGSLGRIALALPIVASKAAIHTVLEGLE